MKQLIWLSDIHLNFLQPSQQCEFLLGVASSKPDAVLVTGDIGDSTDVAQHLTAMAGTFKCPVYFVLGNHDFYHASIAGVRQSVAQIVEKHPTLTWLSQSGVVALTENTGLIGHDGWADGRLGNYARSTVMLNDFILIREFVPLNKQRRLDLLNRLGDEAAQHIARALPLALQQFQHVFLLTHVPPFREACWHEGKVSGDEWLPHMTCHAVGLAILQCMQTHPDRKLIVLCGHTHSGGEAWPAANVRVLTGAAVYRSPRVAGAFGVP